MVITVDDMRAGIRARGYEMDTDAQQLILLNQAQRRWFGQHRWDVARTFVSQAVAAGVGDYDFPVDSTHIDSVMVTPAAGQPTEELEWVPPGELLRARASQSVNSTGALRAWSRIGPSTLALYPTPSRAATLTVRYFRAPPLLVNGSDVPLIPETYSDILVVSVCETMAQRERQYEAARMFRDERLELERQARAQLGVVQQQTSVEVAKSGFYSIYDRDGRAWH